MESPNFTHFMLKKIAENPEMAEINSAILSLYKNGMLDVWWDSSSEEFMLKASPFGKQSLNEHFASNFIPAEA